MHAIVPYDPPGIIYCATLPNGKRYVGKTTHPLRARIYQHMKDAQRGSRTAFHSAMRALGQPTWAILYRGHALSLLERHYIARLSTKKPLGYNLTDGGEGSPGAIPSTATRRLLSLARSGRRNPMYGRKRPDTAERNKRMSGENAPCYGRVGEQHPMYGRTGAKSPRYGIPRPDLAELNRERARKRRSGKQPTLF